MALLAADFTGVWSADLAPSIPFRLTLQQTADSISGSHEIGGRVIPIENARVEGERLTFTISVPAAGRLRRLSLSAVLKEDHLSLVTAGQERILNRVNPSAEEVRLERLAATIRLWGTVKFFHPYLAYRTIDWDAAFITAIRQVNHAASHDDFVLALAGMLAKLDDPETRVLGIRELDPRPVPCQCRALVRSGLYAPADSTPYYADWENVGQREPYILRSANSLRVAMRTAEPVPSAGAGINMTDNPYNGDLPSPEYRLLALARYWNAIQYFYGYTGSVESWNSALTEFIPQFEHAGTSRDYLFTLSRLASRTHDGHSFLGGFTGSVLSSLGKTPDVSLRNLAGQIVVTASASQSLQPGDVITTVNRKPALENEKFLLTLIPHSTPQWGTLAADRFLLAGPEPTVHVGVRRGGGKEEELELTRDVETVSVRPAPPLSTVFGKLPSGLGYIDLRELQAPGVDRAFDELMDTPGLILDLRGAASPIFTQLAARLTSGKPVAAARIRQRVWHGPNPQAVTEDTFLQYAYPGAKAAYSAPVAVLIDARAFSAAEHTALFLRAAANAVFVGSPTSGTNGNITHLILPGSIQANFAAMEISHPDGAPLQRVGILPDVWIEPTVKGLQQGRDEVLERAVELLTRK